MFQKVPSLFGKQKGSSNNPEISNPGGRFNSHKDQSEVPFFWKASMALDINNQTLKFDDLPTRLIRFTSFEEKIAENQASNIVSILNQFCSKTKKNGEQAKTKQRVLEAQEEELFKISYLKGEKVLQGIEKVLKHEDSALFLQKVEIYNVGEDKDFILAVIFLIMSEYSKIPMKGGSEKRRKLYIEENVKHLSGKIQKMLKENEFVEHKDFKGVVEQVGKILMLYLEGIYQQDPLFESMQQTSFENIKGCEPRKMVKSILTHDNYNL